MRGPGAMALLLAAALLLFAATAELVAAVGFALGIPVAAAHLGLAAVLALAGTAAGARRLLGPGWPGPFAAAAVASAAVVAGSVLAAGLLHDHSFDGQWYHQSAVLALAGGWNPLGAPLGPADTASFLYVDHYPKGPWILAAALYRLTGHIEQAKAMNLVLAVAAGAAAAAALLSFPALGRRRAAAVAVLAALNPVTVAQLFTFYVDGQLASLLAALAALGALAAWRGGALATAALAAAALLAVNAKFTAVAYVPLLGGAAALAALRIRGRAAAAGLAAAAALGLGLGVLGPGFDPYVTNTVEKGHPFYPLAGPGAVDVMATQLPPRFRSLDRFRKLAISSFAATRSGPSRDDPVAKVPFSIHGGEVPAFQNPDARIGGFGPWFGGALLLALALAAVAAWRGRRASTAPLLAAAALLGSALVNPEAWWARYAPQVWLVPLAAALATAEGRARPAARALAAALLAVLAVDAALVAAGNVSRTLRAERRLRSQLEALGRAPAPVEVTFGDFESGRIRLREAGVRFRETARLSCDAPSEMVSSVARYCSPAGPGSAPPSPGRAPRRIRTPRRVRISPKTEMRSGPARCPPG